MAVQECGPPVERKPSVTKSASGVKKASVKVKTGSDGLTIEQRNVKARLVQDNKPGSIKHLYIISAFSGDVLVYSTVKGKITSGGKRLTPKTVAAGYGTYGQYGERRTWGIPVVIGGANYRTSEVLGDDGTYGSSEPYVYWYDQKGMYHQHFKSSATFLHVSTGPLRVPKVALNLETDAESASLPAPSKGSTGG